MRYEIFNSRGKQGVFVNITQAEAHSLIRSLATQLEQKNSNAGRAEFTSKNGEYFSVSVHSDEEYKYLTRDKQNSKWITDYKDYNIYDSQSGYYLVKKYDECDFEQIPFSTTLDAKEWIDQNSDVKSQSEVT